jgi:hypothetical protein
MTETLTVLRLNLPPTLARTFRSTNAIESMISICRTHAGNVKRWLPGALMVSTASASIARARVPAWWGCSVAVTPPSTTVSEPIRSMGSTRITSLKPITGS